MTKMILKPPSIQLETKKGILGDPDISINKTTQHREQKGSLSTTSIRSLRYDPRLPLISIPVHTCLPPPISDQKKRKTNDSTI